MTSILGTLNIGRVALAAQQTAINVTGHNIANVNTEGYTRQRVNMVSTSITGYRNMSTGSGVDISDVERIYDKFIQRQITSENQQFGYWNGMTNYLEQVEVVFNEASGFGISEAMEAFWNSWNDVSNNPTGYVERVAVVNAGQTLSMTFNQTHESLTQLQDYISTDISANLDDINLKARQVRDLNQQILQRETGGSEANDLRDQRDLLVNGLSELINVNVSEDNNGNVNIFVGSGQPLVNGIDTWELSTAPNPSSTTQDLIVWNDKDGSTIDITENISNGKLKGMIDVRDNVIPDYLDRLNELADTIITQLNDLHSESGIGDIFFNDADPNDPAKYMSMAISDPDQVVTGASTAGPGDNSIAIDIAELQNGITMGGTATFGDFYQSLISDIGNSVQFATNNKTNQTAMVNQLKNYRESISGVSLDEEMVNLVKYQHAYDAAAKLITTIDEMLDTLLSLA